MSVDGVIVRTAQLGGSALSQAVQRGDVGAEWYAHRPTSPAAWRAQALQVRASLDGFDWLTALAPALAATGAFAKARVRHETRPDEVDTHLDKMLASAHHQSGGCAMGPSPESSVVSPDLAVHGVTGLWVADGSVFPDTIINNTNLTCYVIGERAAEIVGRAMEAL